MEFFLLGGLRQEFGVVAIQGGLGGREGADFVVQNLLFLQNQQFLNFFVVVETVAKLFVDAFVHPVFGLTGAFEVEETVCFYEIDEAKNHIQNFGDVVAGSAGIGNHFGFPAGFWHGKEVEGIEELGFGEFGLGEVVAVGFVDDDAVGHFHDAALDALKFVAATGDLNQ